ncbi:MAG: GDP-mannose 4,6-dehydratase [Verrucomicrobiota bacterium]
MKAIITGANGQDARLLATHLRREGWTVKGIVRPGSAMSGEADEVMGLDLLDEEQVRGLVKSFEPDHIYHLAACHHSSEQVGSAAIEHEMVQVNFQAAEVLAATVAALRPACRLLCAGSSQMYTPPRAGYLSVVEDTVERPSTFYGYTKKWSRELLSHYRACRGVFGVTCILFNHESTLRSPRYITRKVSMAAAAVASGLSGDLSINNIGAEVDWSDARDIVAGMFLAMTASTPADYVLASGQTRTVEELLRVAFGHVGRDWRDFVKERRGPPAGALVGGIDRATNRLGWSPKISFTDMVKEMVEHDIALTANQKDLPCYERGGSSRPGREAS